MMKQKTTWPACCAKEKAKYTSVTVLQGDVKTLSGSSSAGIASIQRINAGVDNQNKTISNHAIQQPNKLHNI